MAEKHLPYLDGWRGLAIGCLLIGHFFPIPGLGLGTIGVNLFFVLSGLLMARVLFVDHVPIPAFYRRRIARIMPGFIVFVVLVTLAYVLLGKPVSWSEVATAASFTKNYFLASAGETAMPFGHIWSLSVEEHSYILLTLLVVVSRWLGISGKVAMLSVAALCMCMAGLYQSMYTGRSLSLHFAHTEVAAFGIFFSGGLFLLFRQLSLPRLPASFYLMFGAIGAALHWWSVPDGVPGMAGVAIFAVVINLLVVAPPAILRMLAHPVLRKLGLWSFSIYIWQQPFYYLAHRGEMSGAVGLLLGVAAGIASYYLVECPARSYLNRHWGAPRTSAVAGTQPAA